MDMLLMIHLITSIGEIKYTKLNKIGELTIYSPIES